MNRSRLLWGLLLILAGVLILLDTLGYLALGPILWPLLLIGLGLWILLGILYRPSAPPSETREVPLQGAGRARIRIRHGAGRLSVAAGVSSPDRLLEFGCKSR